MKKINLIIFCTVSLVLANAQSEKKTKESRSVTIEKYKDKDGNQVIEKKVLEGDAVKKEIDEKGGRSVKIYSDSMGKGTKIIIDENIKIEDDDDDVLFKARSGGSGYTERTVTIKKNADGSVEIKENTGDDFLSRANIRVDSAETKKPSLGVSLDDDLRITNLMNSGAAESAGLKHDDVLTHFDGTFVEDYNHLKSLISKKQVGDKVIITYLRNRKEMKSTVILKGGSTRVYFNR